MSRISIKIESFEIPQFYATLQKLGINQKPPKSNYEAFRGEYEGEAIVIFHSGKIQFQKTPEIEEKINQVIKKLHIKPSGRDENSKNRYVILAKHGKPAKEREYFHQHLNIWLTVEQYYQAIEFFSNQAGTTEKSPQHQFEEKIFERDGNKLKFHLNGKIISENGYKTFAPFLREIIKENTPFKEYDLIIGQDEVGNGEKIGPLVISSVAATPNQIVDLQLAGIKDSKMIPHRLTPVMSNWISQLAMETNTWKLNPDEYNQIVLGHNFHINDILRWGHTKSFYKILDKLDMKLRERRILLLVDRFDWNIKLDELEQNPLIDIDIMYASNGESKSISVAAASIVAKARQYRWLKLHEKLFQLELKRKNIKNIRMNQNAPKLLKL